MERLGDAPRDRVVVRDPEDQRLLPVEQTHRCLQQIETAEFWATGPGAEHEPRAALHAFAVLRPTATIPSARCPPTPVPTSVPPSAAFVPSSSMPTACSCTGASRSRARR